MQNLIELIITARDLASTPVSGILGRIDAATKAYDKTLQDLGGTANSTTSSLLQIGGAVFGIAAIKKGFEEGIKTVDEFRLTTIGVAATLTDMAKEGTNDLKAVYDANLSYAEDTYERVELAAAKWFASGKEMVEAWKILTQKGTIVSTDKDISNLGVIVDKIKLATAGQVASLQIAQELRSVMNGQARATDQIAMMLKDQIGPGWEDQLKTAREEGRVLEWLAEKFQGLRYASGDIEKTLESQRSTLGTMLSQVGRAGLAGAYDDIVGLVRDINEYLMTHKELVATQIKGAWDSVKPVIFGVRDAIQEINSLVEKHPVAAGWVGGFLKVAAEIAILSVALRGVISVGKYFYASFAANLAFLGKLFGGIAGMLTALAAPGGPIAWVTVAIAAAIATIATMSLAEWIGEWEIAGTKIKTYVELGQLHLKLFYLYIRDDFAGDVKIAISGMWDHLVTALTTAILKAWKKLKGFVNDVLLIARDPFGLAGSEAMGGTGLTVPDVQGGPGAPASIKPGQAVKTSERDLVEARLAVIQAERYFASLKEYEDPSYPKPKASPVRPPTPSGKEDKGAFSAAKQLAAAELELAKATSKHKLALIENEQAEVEAAYKQQFISAEQYYSELRSLNDREFQAKIEGIQGEIAAVKKGSEQQLEAAKKEGQAEAVALKTKAKLMELEDQLTKARVEAHRTEIDLLERERRAIQERASISARALNDILGQEQISAEQRIQIGQRLREAQVAEIRAEAEEIERKTEGRVKAEEWAAAKIKEISKDLRGYSTEQLKRMLEDEETTLKQREIIWKQIEENIKAGEVSTWEALKLGVQRGFEEFKNTAQSMYQIGRNFIADLKSGFSDFFSKTMKGEIKSIGDAWEALCDLMTNAFSKAVSDIMAEMLTSGIMDMLKGGGGGGGGGGWLGSLFSSIFGGRTAADSGVWQSAGLQDYIFTPGLYHSGGMAGQSTTYRLVPASIFSGAKRLHGGLAPDEFPAILQTGEEVRSRAQVRADREARSGGGSESMEVHSHFHISAMDGPSLREFVSRNKHVFTEPLLDALKRNGPVRKAIRGTM